MLRQFEALTLLISDRYGPILPDCLWLIFLFAIPVKGERAMASSEELNPAALRVFHGQIPIARMGNDEAPKNGDDQASGLLQLVPPAAFAQIDSADARLFARSSESGEGVGSAGKEPGNWGEAVSEEATKADDSVALGDNRKTLCASS